MEITLGELSEQIGGDAHGDRDCVIRGVATLGRAGPGDVSFFVDPRYRRALTATSASAVILSAEALEACPVHAIVADNPYLAYARTAALFEAPMPRRRGVHEHAVLASGCDVAATAWVGPLSVVETGARIGAEAFIGPGCVIGAGATVGTGCRLIANVTLCREVRLGRNVILHPGVVVGSDGFGLANDAGRWVKVPHLGGVSIGDDVEIGANTTIDRGSIDDTVIGRGVKIDNQVQVAHNVRIGADTAIAGCVGIAGSADIGERCAIGGGAGILGHLRIASDVQITPMSLVTRSISRPGVYSSGTPLQEKTVWRRNFARAKRLDEMARRVQALERTLRAHLKGK